MTAERYATQADAEAAIDQLVEFVTQQKGITKHGVALILRRLAANIFTEWYDDERVAATAINPPGLGSDPGYDTTIGGYLFDSGSTELLFLVLQLSHRFKEGSNLYPHVHWTKTTSAAGNVLWQLDYRLAPVGAVFDAAWTTDTASTVATGTPDNNTANEHLITPFAAIDGSTLGISDMLLMKLSRLGADGSDTYGADARLLEFDIHFLSDAGGSLEEYVK